MENKGVLTKTLAIGGTALVWFPVLATVVTAVAATIISRRLLFDYLMPAELFPAAFAGGLLLIWPALRARSHIKSIAWGLAAIIVFLAACIGLASLSGISSGAAEPVGLPWILVIACLVLYTLALLELCAAGLSLVTKLFSAK